MMHIPMPGNRTIQRALDLLDLDRRASRRAVPGVAAFTHLEGAGVAVVWFEQALGLPGSLRGDFPPLTHLIEAR